MVWTAGHSVNEGPGEFATNWEFVPAYKDGTAPRGVYVADNLHHELGVGQLRRLQLRLRRRRGRPGRRHRADRPCRRPGDRFNDARSQNYMSYGYPAAPPFTGERLWPCNSPLQKSDNGANPATMGIGCDMTGGSSGGGWIVGGNLYWVNWYGYDNQPNVMYGPYLGSVAQYVYNAASAD